MKIHHAASLITALAIAVVSACGLAPRAGRPDPRGDDRGDAQDKASVWMKHKLIASQSILDGMTRADYELIEKNAQGLRYMGYLEGRTRAEIPGYLAQLRAFDHASGELVRSAHEKNLDGVTIAYTQLMLSCVQCHKVVREKSKP